MTPTVEPTTVQLLPLTALQESPHNPRKHFDAAKLKELSESLRSVGVIQPLTVRPTAKGGYEIAAGHRRYRAAKLAQLERVPCLIRPLTDQQFMECMTIDNLQREDVHPLDEAQGYAALMAAPYSMKVEALAQKVGKSVRYVYDAKALLKLTPDAQELFWADRIDKSIAVLLTRLTPAEQATVIGSPEAGYLDGGLFQAEQGLYDEDQPDEQDQIKARSVREVEAYIKRQIRFDATSADAFLFPETVAQVTAATQQKRKIIEITHEYLASDAVRQAGASRVYGELAWKRADGKEGSKVCERSVLGVIASGYGQGEAFPVCINKDRCEVHWGTEIRAREKRATASPEERTRIDAKRSVEEKKRQDEAKVRMDKQNQWNQASKRIVAAVVERVKTMDAKPTGYLAGLVVDYMWHVGEVPGLTRGKSHEDLIRFLGAKVLAEQVEDYRAYETFPKTAKYLGLDLSPFLTVKPVQTSAAPSKAATTSKPKGATKSTTKAATTSKPKGRPKGKTKGRTRAAVTTPATRKAAA